MSFNERITEDIVRNHFKNDPMYESVKLEEQSSALNRINEILKSASKSGKGYKGSPEFIISFPHIKSNSLIVIECKGDLSKHKSRELNNPKLFAVDGAIHYGKQLSREFQVISVAVSGQSEKELKVSTFLHDKKSYKNTKNNKLLSISDYIHIFNDRDFREQIKDLDIVSKAINLNNVFQNNSIPEYERCTIVSAILIALKDNYFRDKFEQLDSVKKIASYIIEAIKRELQSLDVKNSTEMLLEFKKIINQPIFKQENQIETLKNNIIHYIKNNVYPLLSSHSGSDVIGRFYTEFIRYAGSKNKQGLVLTPSHITDLFCDLARTNSKNYVYDPCCGTGGFLVSAMRKMLHDAGDQGQLKKRIKKEQLIGVEIRPDMATYASTNMMFRGDGKSNIYNGDCFLLEEKIKSNHKNIDTVLLNPPYDVGNDGQMKFIEHGLNVVKQRGLVVAVVQMSCAIKNEKKLEAIKERLLNNHKLKAVISLPNDVFYPVGVVTCIMIWEKGTPNAGNETWFGYLKDDGFEKVKHKGRVNLRNKWKEIKTNFLAIFNNNRSIPGCSIKKEVFLDSEWCAEAYMETDYSTLKEEDFINTIKKYIAFQFLNGDTHK